MDIRIRLCIKSTICSIYKAAPMWCVTFIYINIHVCIFTAIMPILLL